LKLFIEHVSSRYEVYLAFTAILLENLLTVEEVSDEQERKEAGEEICEEMARYGKVKAVEITTVAAAAGEGNNNKEEQPSEAASSSSPSQGVQVTVRYEANDEAMRAFNAMSAKYFAGRKVQATLIP
jgi:hypothetical protein